MLSGAACLHATTPLEAEGFRRAGYQGAITVVPNGVDVPDYDVARLREEADEFWPVFRNRRVVLFLSRFSPEKGLDLLLPAFRDLAMRPAYDDVILVLAGSGHRSGVKMAMNLAKELGVADRVVMPGFVRGRQKAMLLCRTDVYTLPSYSEGFSVSVLEALALGVPVLITTGCDFPEVQEVGAGLCCSPARDDLARGFVSLLDMPQAEVDEFRRRGRALVRDKYTWAAIAGKLMTVYDCILSGRPVPRDPAPMGSVARCS